MAKSRTVEFGVVDCTEQRRLNEAREAGVPWKKWGPYLSERQWGTVRADFSADGNAWNYFTHDQSRSRAYRWGEDGLAGISDDPQPLLRHSTLERAGPHPQGAGVRPLQQRGEPRRGRQGVLLLLLPRLDAVALVHEVPLQVPAARVSLPGLQQRDVRRQLELARADLDAGQRADRPRAPEPLRLLRRRFQGRVPDRYFHGDNGAGIGASHQTGWTGLVARLLDLFGRVTAQDALETPKEKLDARLVRAQVRGE